MGRERERDRVTEGKTKTGKLLTHKGFKGLRFVNHTIFHTVTSWPNYVPQQAEKPRSHQAMQPNTYDWKTSGRTKESTPNKDESGTGVLVVVWIDIVVKLDRVKDDTEIAKILNPKH